MNCNSQNSPDRIAVWGVLGVAVHTSWLRLRNPDLDMEVAMQALWHPKIDFGGNYSPLEQLSHLSPLTHFQAMKNASSQFLVWHSGWHMLWDSTLSFSLNCLCKGHPQWEWHSLSNNNVVTLLAGRRWNCGQGNLPETVSCTQRSEMKM